MIQNENTIIFTIRDRDAERIKSLVESARNNGIRSQFLLLDYGSQNSNSIVYEKICKELNIGYVKTHTEGLPWSRARALNTGIRAAKTKYVTTTDVDMLFASNPYEEIDTLLKQNSDKTVYYAMSYWLPKNGDIKKAKCAGVSAKGGFQFLEKALAEEMGGYDERIKYWGMEDLDWGNRLQNTMFPLHGFLTKTGYTTNGTRTRKPAFCVRIRPNMTACAHSAKTIIIRY